MALDLDDGFGDMWTYGIGVVTQDGTSGGVQGLAINFETDGFGIPYGQSAPATERINVQIPLGDYFLP